MPFESALRERLGTKRVLHPRRYPKNPRHLHRGNAESSSYRCAPREFPLSRNCGRRLGGDEVRLVVISPFLDRRHGTERVVSELIERLARNYGCEIHVYSQRVEDLSLMPLDQLPPAKGAGIRWHRVVSIPGPHLIRYIWWLVANALHRWWDARFKKLAPDLVFSPGV